MSVGWGKDNAGYQSRKEESSVTMLKAGRPSCDGTTEVVREGRRLNEKKVSVSI